MIFIIFKDQKAFQNKNAFNASRLIVLRGNLIGRLWRSSKLLLYFVFVEMTQLLPERRMFLTKNASIAFLKSQVYRKPNAEASFSTPQPLTVLVEMRLLPREYWIFKIVGDPLLSWVWLLLLERNLWASFLLVLQRDFWKTFNVKQTIIRPWATGRD